MTLDVLLPDLFELFRPFHARPDYPIEAEEFFTTLVSQFSDRDACLNYIRLHLPTWFRSLSRRPDWIQGEEWLWWNGKPMVFVGSIDAPPGTFHDDGRFYLFWCPDSGVTRAVIQVA
jgi:hypothetical protein